MISIRDATAPDITAIEAVRRASWRAAYAGLIGQAHLDRATTGPFDPPRVPASRRTVVAVEGDDATVVGYSSFGPERAVHALALTPAAVAGELPRYTDAGSAGQVGEVYAIYLDPACWSRGAGRALMDAAVAWLAAAGYERAVLWVLADNARARRFYEIAGWRPDGTDNRLASLGGVTETRYTRPLALPPAGGLARGRAGCRRLTGRAVRWPVRPRAGAAGPGARRAAEGRPPSA
ncbi:MAG TPA: GNAT family N-acetyltransferase [Trebonia sp.]|nr:GNAT family N-acetyltransferase [Trebonia sp.]